MKHAFFEAEVQTRFESLTQEYKVQIEMQALPPELLLERFAQSKALNQIYQELAGELQRRNEELSNLWPQGLKNIRNLRDDVNRLGDSLRIGLEGISELDLDAVMNEATSQAKTVLARTAAEARHAENRIMKDEVFLWLESNMRNFKSMDKAAQFIAGGVAPIAFRTARKWVGEWKKLPSAGTP